MTTKTFFKNLLFMLLFLVLLVVGVNIWLRSYTNHGQQLKLPDFQEMHIRDAKKLASDQSFTIIVNDSTHRVGMPGGLIINQNPDPNSMVKENRKIYVTTTKYIADQVRVSSLPELYGRNYEQKKKELSHMQINSRVQSKMYDPGEPGHILEVYYKGKLIADKEGRKSDVKIDKGSTLGFVISQRSGLELSVPDLRCQTLAAAQFIIEDGSKLKLGTIRTIGEVNDQGSAYVVSQYPKYDPNVKVVIGEAVDLVISAEKPEDCN